MAVALYARVSTTKQAEKDLSIPDQLRQMREWCTGHGFAVAAEYIEPGASATDDRRPVLQQMIAEATLAPSPYEAIIVHSLSRFFRDSLEFGLYERKLNKAGVKLISVTQQTSDDPSGEMARKIFSVFDEYQSKENSKHTLRAMKENARKGFLNGSRPPFGYRAIEVDIVGNKGRKKKRLAVDPVEAEIVRQIYALYLNGYEGRAMGMKSIAEYLNERGLLMRGRPWRLQKVFQVLSSGVYVGEYFFNCHDSKNKCRKPDSEWVRMETPLIIDEGTFARVRERRSARAPEKVHPRVLSSPALLTGLLKCDGCGAGMTLATGKSGRYKYYKCTTRISRGNRYCQSHNIPTEKIERLVLERVADRVFVPARVKVMLSELQRLRKNSKTEDDEKLLKLSKELAALKIKTDRLYEAVENGLLPMDDSLGGRARLLQVRRQEILTEIAGLRRKQELPLSKISKKHIQAFCNALRDRLLNGQAGFAKEYLKLLVDEIRVVGREAAIRGSYLALVHSLGEIKPDTPKEVPRFISYWRPGIVPS